LPLSATAASAASARGPYFTSTLSPGSNAWRAVAPVSRPMRACSFAASGVVAGVVFDETTTPSRRMISRTVGRPSTVRVRAASPHCGV
jgi:hypothetical protein